MTVKELIEKLKNYPLEMDVFLIVSHWKRNEHLQGEAIDIELANGFDDYQFIQIIAEC
jgi:hypothetical protein